MSIVQTGGRIRKFTYSWPWQSGEFTNLKLSGRTLTGEAAFVEVAWPV